MESCKLNFLIPTIVGHCLVYEYLQIVVESFEKLNGFDLPHLLHLDAVKHIFILSLRGLSSRLLWLQISLEHNDEELAVVSL